MKLLVLVMAIAGGGGASKDRVYIIFGDLNNPIVLDTEGPVDEYFLAESLGSHDNNSYWLFTRANPKEKDVVVLQDNDSVHNSHFDPAKNTVFLAHGWLSDGGNPMNLALTEAFLQNDDVNVIVLDWHCLANKNYATAKLGVAEVGRRLGQFINWLTTLGLDYEKTHLLGHSLGGHLVGNAGRETGSRVRRITAMDPAGPDWTDDNDRIVASDAQYVEVIHTNMLLLGYAEPCGDADFYPNGGAVMPGCDSILCHHERSWKYTAYSVKYNDLDAHKCDTYVDATLNTCFGDLYPMGNSDLNKNRSGIFRVNTKGDYPY